MVQIVTCMVSYSHCMTRVTEKFPPIFCVIGSSSTFSVHLGPILYLLVGGPANVKSLSLATETKLTSNNLIIMKTFR